MSLLKISLITALGTVLLTSAGQYHLQVGRSQEAARLRAESVQLRMLASQHHALQQQIDVAAQKARSKPVPSVQRSEAAVIDRQSMPSTEVVPVLGTEYRNEGQATPVATLQTLAWACDHGDAALMQKLIVYDASARKKAVAHLATLPPEERLPVEALDAVAADLYISDGMKHPYPSAAILQLAKFESLNPERVRLHLPGANGDDYEFQHTSEGWKLAVTDEVVDNYIKESSQLPAKP